MQIVKIGHTIEHNGNINLILEDGGDMPAGCIVVFIGKDDNESYQELKDLVEK